MTESAAERAGLKGRLTIRRAKPGQKSEGPRVGIWDLRGVKPGTSLARMQKAYTDCLAAVDAAEDRKASALSSGKLTPAGVKEDLISFTTRQLAATFYKAKAQVDLAKKEVAERRAVLKPAPADKTDFAGALLRSELRGWFSSKTQKERDDFITANIDKLDPQMAQAFVELPAEVSGISPAQRELLADRALEAAHPGELAEITQLERAVQLADAAVNLGRGEIAKEAEVSLKDFNTLAEPFEAQTRALPWLRKDSGGVSVWDDQLKVYRVPTPDELAALQYFKSSDEYRTANGLPLLDKNGNELLEDTLRSKGLL